MKDLAPERHTHFLAWMRSAELNANRVAVQSGIAYTTVKTYVDTPSASLKGSHEARIAQTFDLPVEAIFGTTRPEPNFVGAWRAEVGMTQEALAEAMKTTLSMVEWLEDAPTLSDKWRRRLADAFDIPTGLVLMDPEDVGSGLLREAARFRGDAQQALDMLKLLNRRAA